MLEATDQLLPVLATWDHSDAFGWVLALRAKVFRFLDDLSGVLDAAESGLEVIGDHGMVAAHLHLEAGMALNQFDRQPEALVHLRAADRTFAEAQDDSGRSWALVSLAEALAGSGYREDPELPLQLALELADRAGDQRSARRAWKQLAVMHRHRGQVPEGLEAIGRALDGLPTGHTRANYVLERGQLLTMSGNYNGADEAFEEAAALFAEYGDTLGQANTERALAVSALVLGRHREGLRRLDRAVALYQQIQSVNGLAYTLRERATVRLAEGDETGARSDVEEGLASFARSPDVLGRAGMLRVAARVRQATGDELGARNALAEARSLIADGTNPLAEAGILSMEAEIAASPEQRLRAANASAVLYRRMGVGLGEALALSHAATMHADLGNQAAALAVIGQSAAVLRATRLRVADPGRRADHDFALRDVTTNLVTAAVRVGTPAAARAAADLLLDEAPLGLRTCVQTGQLSRPVRALLRRVAALRPTDGTQRDTPRHLLQHLGAHLTTLDPQQHPEWLSFESFAASHGDAVVLIFGAPTRDSALPVAWCLPGGRPEIDLHPLSEDSIGSIDALGSALSTDRAGVLWKPGQRSWQHDLVEVFLPLAVRQFLLSAAIPAQVVVSLPPILSHVPIEALLLAEIPIGVRASIVRIPVVSTQSTPAELREVIAYLDPAHPWGPERRALGHWTHDAAELRAGLGPQRLILVASHGESAMRAEGRLIASDGTPVADSIDLLTASLQGSVVLLESCYTGRHIGHRSADQLNPAVVSLLAGASASIAGIFALPSDDACTGIIAAECVRALRDGSVPPEALRRARLAYWTRRPSSVRLPGAGDRVMPGDAPWAWAGLCAFGR